MFKVKINYDVLEIDHIVEFIQDNTLFAAARENGNGHLRIFLINASTGNVYTRNGRVDSWEQLYGSERYGVIARLLHARNSNTPVFKINGTSAEYQAA